MRAAGSSSRGQVAALRRALATHSTWPAAPVVPLRDKGLAHSHIRLLGTGALARIPKQSQVGLAPSANLMHQAACFRRAASCGHTPRLLGTLDVSADLPRGALLVEDIAGRPARLPQDLRAIAAALAALHALPVPASAERAPLSSPDDPVEAVVQQVQAQARHVTGAGLDGAALAVLQEELAQLPLLGSGAARPPVQLIAFDAHPGNFLVRDDGAAVLVDLEKCRYAHAGLDLAHATLYTSTTWDADTTAVLQLHEVLDFYRAWEELAGPVKAAAARPWHVRLRRLMWLWSLTWCCQWRVESSQPPRCPAHGQDWSAAHSDAALVAHVRARVDDYLSPTGIGRVRHELEALGRALG